MDNISNMLSTIKNASMIQKKFVEVPHTKACESIAKVLSGSGYVGGVKTFKEKDSVKKGLHIDLNNKISDIKRISKPGRRKYMSYSEFAPLLRRYDLVVVSTSRGVMSAQEALNKKLGGEIVCGVL